MSENSRHEHFRMNSVASSVPRTISNTSFSSQSYSSPVSRNTSKKATPRSAKIDINNSSDEYEGEVVSNDLIKVIVRFRPPKPSTSNKHGNFADSLNVDEKLSTIDVSGDSVLDKKFTFDKVIGPLAKQEEVFSEVEAVVDSVLQGINGAILAYGQTASGKTYTMEGPSLFDTSSQGIISRSIDKLFKLISQSPDNIEFQIIASYIEVYNEKLRDLLNPAQDNMKIRDSRSDGFVISDITESVCKDKEGLLELIQLGKANRASAPTLMNAESSRSHSIFSISVIQKNLETDRKKRARLYLVDLAGSEKVGKTGATGARLEEAKNINSSLTTLGMVINALCEGQSHVPYRDSNLTKVLMDTLGGNSKTCLVICCAPEPSHVPETISSLRFGERAKKVKNSARVNEEISVKELKSLLFQAKKEIEALKKRLQIYESNIETRSASNSIVSDDGLSVLSSNGTPNKPEFAYLPSQILTRRMSAKSIEISRRVDDLLKMTGDEWKIEEGEENDDDHENSSKSPNYVIEKLKSEKALLQDDLDEERGRFEHERSWRLQLESEVFALKETVSDLELRLVKATERPSRETSRSATPIHPIQSVSPMKDPSKSINDLYSLMEGVMSTINTAASSPVKGLAPNSPRKPQPKKVDEDGIEERKNSVDIQASLSLEHDYDERLSLLHDNFDKRVENLSSRLAEERQARLLAEKQLEKALNTLDSINGGEKTFPPSAPSGAGLNILSYFLNPATSATESVPERKNQVALELAESQQQVIKLTQELEAIRNTHAIVLETKESVFRQLIRQNSLLTAERDSLKLSVDHLKSKNDSLADLLQNLQSRGGPHIRVVDSYHANKIVGGYK